MKIYTKNGDKGFTKLANGVTISKHDCLVEAYGTVDELSSFIGLAIASLSQSDYTDVLTWVQRRLFQVASILAGAPGEVSQADVERLEGAIDAMDAKLPSLENFILPGGCQEAALLHVARSVCRRAERLIVAVLDELDAEHEQFLPFLNRLSDFLFCAARYENYQAGLFEETPQEVGPAR
jgi:cob(I)alamin adenosyltransferase